MATRYMTNVSQMTTFIANQLIFKTDNMASGSHSVLVGFLLLDLQFYVYALLVPLSFFF
jgi:hypothetical protein